MSQNGCLVINKELAVSADAWVDQLVFTKKRQFALIDMNGSPIKSMDNNADFKNTNNSMRHR